MALKALVTDINTVPEALRTEYIKQDDGTFVLDVTDADYKTKLEEFRTNNRTLNAKKKELEEQLVKFKDVDPTKYNEAMEALKKVNEGEDAELIKAGKMDEVLNKRTALMKQNYDQQLTQKDQALTQSEQARKALELNYRDLKLNQEIIGTIDKIGKVRQGALPDLLSRAKGDWVVDEAGQLVARNPDGTQKYGAKGEPLTIEEWGRGQLQNAAHLFEPSSGGGANGGDKRNLPADGKRRLINPSPEEMGKHAKDIATGKIEVVRTDQSLPA